MELRKRGYLSEAWRTRQTLIHRAKNPSDGQAWEEFVHYYRDFISVVIAKMIRNSHTREDLSQEVLVKVWKSLQNMELGKNKAKFRTWLSTIIKNTTLNFLEREKHRKTVDLDQVIVAMEPEKASEVDQMIEAEWEKNVTNLAMERIKEAFTGKAVEVFIKSVEGKSTEEICEELDVKANTVYVLKNRVKSRFIEEIKQLREELENFKLNKD